MHGRTTANEPLDSGQSVPVRWKTALMAAIGVNIAVESSMALCGFFAPRLFHTMFGLKMTTDTEFLLHIVSYLLVWLVVSLIAALQLVRRGQRRGWQLALALGVLMTAYSLSMVIFFHYRSFLLLDTSRAVVMTMLASRGALGSMKDRQL